MPQMSMGQFGGYGVRPAYYLTSVDGDQDLTHLHWSHWSSTWAMATGSEEVRCWSGHPYPACPGGGGVQDSFEAPVYITLAQPVHGYFSRITVFAQSVFPRVNYYGGIQTVNFYEPVKVP